MSKLYAVNEGSCCMVEFEIVKETENQYIIARDKTYNKRLRKSEMYDKWHSEKFFKTEEEAKKYLKDYIIQTIIRNEEKIKRLTQQNIELKELLKKEQ